MIYWSRMKTSMTIVIEGFRHRYQPILGVQFQVDASPGPRENTLFLRRIFRVD